MSNNISIKLVPRLTPACVCMSNTTLQSIPPYSLGQLLGQLYGLVIESMDAKNKTQAKTHAHKQSSIKKQTGCCATQIILNCCETVFQNSPSIKETRYF